MSWEFPDFSTEIPASWDHLILLGRLQGYVVFLLDLVLSESGGSFIMECLTNLYMGDMKIDTAYSCD